MSRRNVVWLVAIVVIGAAAWIVGGWLWGVLAAVATLVLSEIVERTRRARIRRERGADATSVGVRDAIGRRRRNR